MVDREQVNRKTVEKGLKIKAPAFRVAAVPPDVRKVYDLPKAPSEHFGATPPGRGTAPKSYLGTRRWGRAAIAHQAASRETRSRVFFISNDFPFVISIYHSPITIYHPRVSSQPRTLIIINDVAARARRAWPIIRARLDESGIDYDVEQTEGPGDATTRVRGALERGCSLIGVVGGDGTLSEAAAGYFLPHSESKSLADALPEPINRLAALAVLPAGTGDDFARNLAGERVPLERWIETFIAHCRNSSEQTTRLIDLLRVRTNNYERHVICINASTLGLGGETGARVAAQGKQMRRLSGEARFVVAAMGALVAWRERRVRVEIDG